MSHGLTRVLGAALVTALAAGMLPRPAHPAWPHDPNINVPLCTASDHQFDQVIVSDGAGGAIVAWEDRRLGLGATDIYVQRVGASGTPSWTANGVLVCSALGDQTYPGIASDGSGGAIIAWQDPRNGVTEIYVQRVNASGVPQWTPNGRLICTGANSRAYPYVLGDGAGGAIIVWQDARSGNWDIYAQRVNASGAPQWTANGVVVCSAAGSQYGQRLVSDGQGGAIIVWQDARSGAGWDVYAQRLTPLGLPYWGADGRAACTAAGNQENLSLVADQSGGAILVWQDARGGSYDIYAQRLDYNGSRLWTWDGVAVCAASGDQYWPALASDGSDGAAIGWSDNRGSSEDIYGQRVGAGGVPLWAADGMALCTMAGRQAMVSIVGDEAGGAILSWFDYRTGNSDIYAQRLSASGYTQWTSQGEAVCTAALDQVSAVLAPDGSGGAIATWVDIRRGYDYDIYAQRIHHFGQLGSPEPAVVSVRDVPNDQGGRIKLAWTASYLDLEPYVQIDSYWILRSSPPALVARAVACGARVVTRPEDLESTAGRVFLATSEGSSTTYWEYLGSQPAFHEANYSYVAATTCDSVAGSNPRTLFKVQARNAGGTKWWFSNVDSGYSVDNLAPAQPAPFAGTYSSGSVALHWGKSPEPDFAQYRLHRGSTSGFVPGPGNLVATLSDTGYVDSPGAPYFYELCAVDVHGNVSPYAFTQPAGTVGVPEAGLPREVWLGRAAPNPIRDGCTIRFGLPRAASVSLAIYDQQGRRVRTLVDGPMPAGERTAAWDGRNDSGRLTPSGLYFVHLMVEGRAHTQRLATVR